MSAKGEVRVESMPLPVVIASRSSVPVKPPLLTKEDAVRLWFANRQLNEQAKAAVQRKETYKRSATTANRRCTELESRLSEIERRANAAEARVRDLSRELAVCETRAATQARAQEQAVPAPSRLLRQRLLCLLRQFHPDRTATTTPGEVAKALNGFVEDFDSVFRTGSS